LRVAVRDSLCVAYFQSATQRMPSPRGGGASACSGKS
jgi:hypothetical protein